MDSRYLISASQDNLENENSAVHGCGPMLRDHVAGDMSIKSISVICSSSSTKTRVNVSTFVLSSSSFVWRFFWYFLTKISHTDLREGLEAHGVKLSRMETRRLIDSVVASDGTNGSISPRYRLPSFSRRPAINFQQFSAMLKSSGRRRDLANTSTGTGARNHYRSAAASASGSAAGRARRKGVTFRDEDGGNEDIGNGSESRHRRRSNDTSALLRASLRRLMFLPTDDDDSVIAEVPAVTGSATANSVGPGLRKRIRRALQVTADARGARRGSKYVDRETVGRAMMACGAPLESELLGDLDRRFDRRGTGEINLEVRRESRALDIEDGAGVELRERPTHYSLYC